MYPQTNSSFFNLPSEVRTIIIQQYIVPSYKISNGLLTKRRSPSERRELPALLLTCKRIYSEAKPITSTHAYLAFYPPSADFCFYGSNLWSITHLEVRILSDQGSQNWCSSGCSLVIDDLLGLKHVGFQYDLIPECHVSDKDAYSMLFASISNHPSLETIRLRGFRPGEWPHEYWQLIKDKAFIDTTPPPKMRRWLESPQYTDEEKENAMSFKSCRVQ
ncbi:hypothetical protein ACHAPJ_003334 [Fusarium lateritium]